MEEYKEGFAEYQVPKRTGLMELLRTSVGSQFVIPVYQRNYTWTANKDVKQFLEDLKGVLFEDYPNHFLGIMIYLEKTLSFDEHELSVIDGQQRLTTTFLTLYAIRSLFKERGKEEKAENLDKQYLCNNDSKDKVKYKLKPLVSDDDVYRLIVEGKLDDIDDEQKKSNVYKNYLYIKRNIESLIETEKETSDGQSTFVTLEDILMALNKLYLVVVPISKKDNPQKIFESINATGVKLTASDLIRNYMLMEVNSEIQEKYYADYWKKIEKYVSNDSTKLESFFRFFLASKNYTLPNKKDVYRVFVSWLKNMKDDIQNELEGSREKSDNSFYIKKVLEEVVLYAEAYNYIYKKDIEVLKKEDEKLAKSIKEYRRILSEMPAPALMKFYLMYKDNEVEAEQFAEIIDIISSYLMRRSLCDMDTSGITKMFPPFLKNVLNDCNGDYEKIIDIVKKNLIAKNAGNAMSMPDDEKLRELIVNANMYNLRSSLRIFFDKLEHNNNPAPVDLSTLSVEHLMPQTPTKKWYKELDITEEEYQKNIHRLGNLTLATKVDNSAMKNKPWEYKNAVLKETGHLKMNEKLLQLDHWNTDEIENRTQELINEIIRLYPYPQIDSTILQRIEIEIDYQDVYAIGYLSLDDGSVEVNEGSIITDSLEEFLEQDDDDLRKELIDEKVIAEVDGVLQFVKPYIFYSKYKNNTALSTTASIICGGNKNGWDYWSDPSTGKTLGKDKKLRDILQKRDVK